MGRILRTAAAERDAEDIWFWIAQDSPNAADRMLASFDSVATLLAERPLIGASRSELGRDIRSFPANPYLLFYRPVAGGVEIIRILHGRRDIDDRLP